MDITKSPISFPALLMCVTVVGLAVAYFVFLWASWQSYQRDREHRNNIVDQILERLPKKPAEAE